MNKKTDTNNLISNIIMIIIVIASIIIIILFFLPVPFLLDFVGIEYTGIWQLIKFSFSIIIIDYCLEGIQEFIINKIAANKTKLLFLIRSIVNIIVLTMITIIISDLMNSIQLSFVGALLFATLLTLLTRVIELILNEN